MTNNKTLTVQTPCRRVDVYLAEQLEFTRSRVKKLCDDGLLTVNGKSAKPNKELKEGDLIEIVIPESKNLDVEPENIPLDVVYEDEQLLVVNKPKGMVVHPAPGNYSGTLVNALLYHCKGSLSGINGVIRPGIVHRIDKDTSGLLIVAKDDSTHRFLAHQIKEHSFKREYEAVVCGGFREESGTVDAPIGRHPVKRKQMTVTDKNSKNAITHYTVVERFEKYTHLRLKLETGRTHQIRVHMAYISRPVFNDPVYNPKHTYSEFSGQCLHAKTIGFIHPNGEYMEFESELPEYFKELLNKLRKQ